MGAGHARSHYLNRKEGDAEGRASDWSEVVTRPRTTRSPPSFWGDGGIVPFEPFLFHAFPRGLEKAAINRISLILPSRKEEREILFPFRGDQEIGSSRKKNACYFTKTCQGKEEGGNKHTWRAQYNGELYAAFGKDESLPKRNLLILSQLDGPAAPGKRIEEASDYFMHAPLGSGGYSSVGRAPPLQLGRCDYGNGEEDRNMPLKDSTETKMGCQERRGGWAVRVGEGQSLILKTSVLKTKESGGKRGGKLSVPGSPVAGTSGTTRILTRGKESKSDSRSSGERNGSSLNRENGVVGEQYKRRAARRSSVNVEEAVAISMAQKRRPTFVKPDELKLPIEGKNFSEAFELSPKESEDLLLKQHCCKGKFERGLVELRKLGIETKLWEESRRLIDPDSIEKTLSRF
ncbi:hypothetical protein BUALT_Bualt19G0021100 [Buddleja alternifolia]|uniref:Uncharacterized protein n=1 Tax=Buddleja alternifolia TaxID=168488 RepID=A0AAV6W1R6_9LAMI|nr:hypothetical protein BUALT_Bualt19G0021100 [Buddleja alternifolia]